MTNRERYVRTFQPLHASADFSMEEWDMKRHNIRFSMPRAAAAAIMAAVLLVSLFTVAYAADLGGIRGQVRLWFHGAQFDAEVTQVDEDGYSYTVTWHDEDGGTHEMGGGGVTYDHGVERPLTMDEYLEHLNEAEIVNTEDGRVMVYYYDQALDITDDFDEEGNCRLALTHDGETMYFIFHGSVDEDWSYWSSPDGFEDVEAIMNDSLSASAVADVEREISLEIGE